MGEAQGTLFEPEFNRSVKVETSQQRITSHAGAVLLRELDHKLGLVESLASQLVDPRDPNRIRYTAVELLRERMYALAMGEENQDDLDRQAHDPALRMAAWDRPGPRRSRRTTSQPADAVAVARLAGQGSPKPRGGAARGVRLDSSPSAEHARCQRSGRQPRDGRHRQLCRASSRRATRRRLQRPRA